MDSGPVTIPRWFLWVQSIVLAAVSPCVIAAVGFLWSINGRMIRVEEAIKYQGKVEDRLGEVEGRCTELRLITGRLSDRIDTLIEEHKKGH